MNDVKLKIRARTLVVHDSKVLLVKNKGMDFWYLPGGGWEYDHESIIDCAEREVTEESGYKVKVERLLWSQELHENEKKVALETFWQASIADGNKQTSEELDKHIDSDPGGMVEAAKWIDAATIKKLKVFPVALKENFDDIVNGTYNPDDPFLGVF